MMSNRYKTLVHGVKHNVTIGTNRLHRFWRKQKSNPDYVDTLMYHKLKNE